MTGTNFRHIAKYLISCVLLCLAVHVNARVFDTGEVIYVKKNPSNWSWYGDNDSDGKFAYFYKEGGSSSAWSEEARTVDQCNDVFKIVVPAGDWTHVILTRNSVHSNPDWSNVYNIGDDNTVNKSADIKIPDNQNYLDNFRQYKDAVSRPESERWHWSDCYFYRPTDDPASVTKIGQADKEIIEVCTQSSGDPLSLQPRLINAIDGYDYIQGRTWFKWDGVKWKELPYANGDWGFSGPGGLNETIGASGSHTYYFLSSKEPAKQRFIEIAVTKDCSSTCEITDFGVVTSSVNVHDSTYTLDGVVAFGDALGQTLRISVTDAKGEHHVDYVAPVTPFIFSLPNLYADGSTLIATASFLGSGCTRNSDPYEAPNAIDGIKTTTLNIKHNDTPTLTPSTLGTDGYKWHDGNTTEHERKIPEYCFDTTLVYTYYEYEPAPTASGNLIEDGDFSADESFYGDINRSIAIKGSAISEYNFWGKDVYAESDFYDRYKDGNNSLFGGFSIVTNANDFWKRFTDKITAKVGDRYALFDADNSGVKKAWFIDTNKSPKLKLAKGTNYMFSFWVANINNYGEMNNAAILQFAIKYKQNGSWSKEELLGNPIDLNNYKDNIWHQNSHVYTSPVDAEEVEIMVRDLNTNKNPGGNDFALDDIQFQAITVHSQAIKNCERFVVNIFEPAVTVNPPAIQIIETPACGKTDFTMQVKVGYSELNTTHPISLQLTDDVYGDLFATPLVIDPATHPTEITLTLSSADYAKLVADGNEHKLTARIIRDDCHGVDKGGQNSNTYTAPGIPALTVIEPTVPTPECDQTTFSLEVETEYAYQTGDELRFYWDEDLHSEAIKSISYGSSATITAKLTNLTYDGKKHTLLVCTNNEVLDCKDSKEVDVPYMPQIISTAADVLPYKCVDETSYKVTVKAEFSNCQGHKLIIEDWDGNKQEIETLLSDTKAEHTFEYAWEAPATHEFKVYFEGAEQCKDEPSHLCTYTAPAKPTISAVSSFEGMECDKTTYTLQLKLTYTNQKGSKFYASVDGGTPVEVANPNPGAQIEKSDVTIKVEGLPADGKEHKYSIWTDKTEDCALNDIPYEAPFAPVINNIKVEPQQMGCKETKYNVIVTFDVTNGQDSLVTVWGKADKHETFVAKEGENTVEFKDVKIDAADDYFDIWFEGANNCKDKHHVEYKEPVTPEISVDPGPSTGDTECNKTTYTVKADILYTNQRGKLFAWIDEDEEHKKEFDYHENKLEKDKVTIAITGLTGDGLGHTLHVKFDGANSCYLDLPYDAPFTPAITKIHKGDLVYNCISDKYEVVLTIDYANGLGREIYIKEGTTVLNHFTTENDTMQHKDEKITVLLDFGTTDHDLNIFFEGFETACPPHHVSIPAVSKPSLGTIKTDYITVCDQTTFDLEVTVEGFVNQDGELTVSIDGKTVKMMPMTPSIDELTTYEPNSPTPQTRTLKVEGLQADGNNTSHELSVAFVDGSHGCANTPAALTGVPHMPAIISVKQAFKPEYVPGETQYHTTLTITYSNALGRDIKIKDGDTEIKSHTVSANAGTEDILLDFDLDGTNHNLKIYFDGREECAKTLNVVSLRESQTICKGDSITDWYDEPTLYPTETTNVFTHLIHDGNAYSEHPSADGQYRDSDDIYRRELQVA